LLPALFRRHLTLRLFPFPARSALPESVCLAFIFFFKQVGRSRDRLGFFFCTRGQNSVIFKPKFFLNMSQPPPALNPQATRHTRQFCPSVWCRLAPYLYVILFFLSQFSPFYFGDMEVGRNKPVRLRYCVRFRLNCQSLTFFLLYDLFCAAGPLRHQEKRLPLITPSGKRFFRSGPSPPSGYTFSWPAEQARTRVFYFVFSKVTR